MSTTPVLEVLPDVDSITVGEQRTTECIECHSTFSYKPVFLLDPNNEFGKPKQCDDCKRIALFRRQQEDEEDRQRQIILARKAKGESWDGPKSLCPPLYRATDPEKLPLPGHLPLVMNWKYGPRGLVLYGPTGLGKTRCMWALLKRLYVEELRRIKCFSPDEFSKECIAHALSEDGGREWISDLAKVDVLFFDDFGQFKFTERVESDLFSLFERRTSMLKPILLTTNLGGKSLKAKMSREKRDPFTRRIAEFCDEIAFEKP